MTRRLSELYREMTATEGEPVVTVDGTSPA
jgi:hypothetical protein